MDFNRNGIGYASLEDNLDQHVRPTLSGSARWKCLINDRGEVWDLGLWTFDGPEIALGEEYLAGFSLPKFRDPQDSLGGGRLWPNHPAIQRANLRSGRSEMAGGRTSTGIDRGLFGSAHRIWVGKLRTH